LLQMMLNGMALPPRPESLILPALEGAAPKALGVAGGAGRRAERGGPKREQRGDMARGGEMGGGVFGGWISFYLVVNFFLGFWVFFFWVFFFLYFFLVAGFVPKG
ncbi:hypothetical protein, partial [Klebsiella pneumoniae]|uniref:hypothetical protein n=1 Tax=Klebsiella pneumoniae TaxID=573 RepID=UPI0023F8FEBB